uniref:InfA n=3 Tax=Geum rupestre TaxID=148910 RepID=A0A8F7CAJ0_9ROSA|nr:initiation factor 1 [Geum rupestre]QXU57468.1 InfA [Geum rupestre var. rupestre]QXU57555.1 InfA [[Taihangia] rupestris var. ciliata]AVI26204.1 initiation factor 1 [Geum rupestre]QZL39017.1 translational initiation factor 1 [Geum rupestre]WEG90450.1 translational initiation factor 1 [Geum rupestre var. rupestre]
MKEQIKNSRGFNYRTTYQWYVCFEFV